MGSEEAFTHCLRYEESRSLGVGRKDRTRRVPELSEGVGPSSDTRCGSCSSRIGNCGELPRTRGQQQHSAQNGVKLNRK